MKKFKAGDIVKPCDGSSVLGIGDDGKFDNGVHGIY
jgi:hypothetical protein